MSGDFHACGALVEEALNSFPEYARGKRIKVLLADVK